MAPAVAAALTDEELRLQPFFEKFIAAGVGEAARFPSYDGSALFAPIGDTTASDQAGEGTTQYKLLAEAIPAMSFAAAANSLSVFGSGNTHMQDYRNEGSYWPAVRWSSYFGERWLHSDIKNVPFTYINKTFEMVVQAGNLSHD